MKNLEKFLSILDGEVDGLLLTSRYSRHYGAEFDIAEGMAIVTKKGCRYFTDSRYIESAQNNIRGFEVLDVNSGRNYAKCINEAIADFGVTALGYEENYLTVAEFMGLEKNLNAKLVPYNAKINGFRDRKEDWELDLLRKAQKAGIAITKAGVTGAEVDGAARKVISDAGYGDYFGHSYGHGVGLEIHEGPNMSFRNEKPIPAGAVTSAEPGIYLPGKFGVRIEDVTIVTADGCEDITNIPKDLLII